MTAAKPPPLLPCFDPSAAAPGLTQEQFRALFEYLYVDAHWYAALPKGQAVRVRFRPRHFRHAFFKEPARAQPRVVWQTERAERILWIGYAVENPTEVRSVGAARVNLFCRLADSATPWFLVVTDRANGELDFVTGYPLSHQEYLKARQTGVVVLRR